ncbi:MAG: pyridoxal 5'-phosphate synthase glutaminase subunit PdxT [Actinomycetota bacterium]|nr:pyridoxal 5'-phosphate synthase glutaminase subunit PdxT [Actinomycetota bacterium]MDA3003492.1 pyridoxal 5'-phosphate synthase glutaminase subunit PdxT [Actinomycetota bacterium]
MVRVSQSKSTKVVGVLALQGAFNRHTRVLGELNVATQEVRTPEDLASVDALVMPGGESTTMSQLLESSELFEPIKKLIHEGMPVFGTCAGMILLAKEIIDGRDDQVSFGAIDIDVQRNAYGRQIDSFEAEIEVDGFNTPFHAVFIRAPRIVKAAQSVEVLAEFGVEIVLARQKNVLVASFHPELSPDQRIHELFVREI